MTLEQTSGQRKGGPFTMKKSLMAFAMLLLLPVVVVSARANEVEVNSAQKEPTAIPPWWPENLERAQADDAKGKPKAEFYLGWVYEEGEGVKQDYAAAMNWYTKAAEQGYTVAQTNLGLMYWLGEGVPKDYKKAVEWLRKAAEKGDANAENGLGLAYTAGVGVPQDYTEAAKWNTKAAEQGMSIAEWNLGSMFAEGQGVPQDFVKAYVWSSLAAEQGKKKAKENADEIAKHMTPEQKEEAEKLLQEKRAAMLSASH